MTTTESTCRCGMAAPTATEPSTPCTCGCCGTPPTREEQITDLHHQRQAVDRRLADLERD
ncbi:MAG: hypothetical protein M3137_05965 [Actinomycetota bacterium]|nr:hypothetical protein [Actinomycetota bacterium]